MIDEVKEHKDEGQLTMIIVSGVPHNNFEWRYHCLRHYPLRFFGYKDKCWVNFATPMEALDFARNTRAKIFQDNSLAILAAHMTSPEDFDEFTLKFSQWAARHDVASFYDSRL